MCTEKTVHLDDLVSDMLRNKCFLDYFCAETCFKGADSTKLSGMKVLLICGEKDKYITREITDRLAEKIGPDCRKCYIKDAPHISWMSDEGMKCTLKAIEDFSKVCDTKEMKKKI